MAKMLSDEETTILFASLAHARGEKGFTEKEATELVEYFVKAKIDDTVFKLVLEGKVIVNWDNEKKEYIAIAKDWDVDKVRKMLPKKNNFFS